jgi:hypothetical protein
MCNADKSYSFVKFLLSLDRFVMIDNLLENPDSSATFIGL